MSTPIVHSVTYSFPNIDALNAEQDRQSAGSYYHRLGHPTIHAVERRLAALEGSEGALLFSSGVAAIASTLVSHLKPGDHVLAQRQCYGGTHTLLEWGVEHMGWSFDLLDARAQEGWESAFRPNTRMLLLETPANPVLSVVDLARAAKLANARGALVAVDNTVASPLGQHPLEHGADFAVYSATKAIGGHSDLLAGLVTGTAAALEPVWKYRKGFGPVPDPEVAWRIERSLKTLPLRLDAMNANALELAQRLSEHPGVVRVFYPGLASHPAHEVARRQMLRGFGPLLSFEVRGGADAAEATVAAFQLVRHAPSLGGAESLASLPAHTSHIQLGVEGRAKAGIPEGLVRLSAGLEEVEDLWADLDQALARSAVLEV